MARLVLRRTKSSLPAQPQCSRSVVSNSASHQFVKKRGSCCTSSSSRGSVPLRSFATSSVLRSTPTKTIKDPDHPSGVYFHQLPDSNRYAISFLSQPPSSSSSASIVGFVTPPSANQIPIYELIVEKPDLVDANRAFTQLMHETLKEECVPQDGLLEYEALLRKDGWAHLNDQRHPLMPGRIATPENIIASVAFTDGELKMESYEPNDVHRIVTSEEGFMELRPNWLMFIKDKCEKVN
ncbi:hypothetical protein CBS101457_000913 [Exobasidium rhododendri]|nr:hypothetical protein CBS101457_000913 [Exobasidium rhododendri]